jgi:L-asparaginase
MSDGDGKRIGLVLTGGTIGCRVEGSGADELVRLRGGEDAPELELVREAVGEGIELSLRRPLRLTSESMAPADWAAIAEAVGSLLTEDRVDTILVLHGTDTMTYTSAALSFMLAEAGPPIVLTGSNSPVGEPGSNARRNVEDSLIALAALDPGVYVLFGEADEPAPVHLGTRVRKVGGPGNAFASVGRAPVGVVRDGRFERASASAGESVVSSDRPVDPGRIGLDPRVLSLRLYPGLDFEWVSAGIDSGEIRGVVLELYPSVTGPAGESGLSVVGFAERCAARGVPVVATIANPMGGDFARYESTAALEAAAVEILPMLPETATVKMMWALGASGEKDAVLDLMRAEMAPQ